MAKDPTATTAYAGLRFGARPGNGPVGRRASVKQRDLIERLVLDIHSLNRELLGLTPPNDKISADDVRAAVNALTPAVAVRSVQWTMNRTDIGPSPLIDKLINDVRVFRARIAAVRKATGKTSQSVPTGPEVADGQTYRAPDGRVFHAYLTQAGHLCLKVWDADADQFVWFGAAVKLPRESVLMSREDAEQFGKATGTCCVCMRHLTNDVSVAAGIGPICASRF